MATGNILLKSREYAKIFLNIKTKYVGTKVPFYHGDNNLFLLGKLVCCSLFLRPGAKRLDRIIMLLYESFFWSDRNGYHYWFLDQALAGSGKTPLSLSGYFRSTGNYGRFTPL